MAPPRTRDKVQTAVQLHRFTRISSGEWQTLRTELPEVSESTLRKHLLDLQVEVAQPWRGVDTSSLDSLEASLLEMTDAYATEPQLSRGSVIAAKDKTRFAARNLKVAPGKRALKSEMVDWMLVWLGDPRMFRAWAILRRGVLAANELNPAKPTQP